MLWLNSEEREILRAGRQRPETVVKYVEVAEKQVMDRPYKNIFYSNKNLTVVFRDGTMISKPNVGVDTFIEVRDAQTEQEIHAALTVADTVTVKDSPVETKAERELVAANLDIFKGYKDFVVKGSDVYLTGVNLAMPASVIASFIEILEHFEEAIRLGRSSLLSRDEYWERLEALKMFWLKLALNTLPQSRQDLLVFCRKNDVRISRNGNLILYRRIVTKTGADTKLVAFISQEYYKLKKQGYDPRQYAIYKIGDTYSLLDLTQFDPYKTPDIKPFCNLQQMYLELPTYDTNTFTAYHDNKVEIKVGGVYSIPDSGINLNNGICAAGGLHAAAVDYDYSGFGDLPVVVLVNPSKAITVPVNETGKLRTTEMFVACVNDKPHGIHFDDSALSAFDAEYHDLTLTQLEIVAKSKSFESMAVKDTVPAVSLVDIKAITEMLKKRIVNI